MKIKTKLIIGVALLICCVTAAAATIPDTVKFLYTYDSIFDMATFHNPTLSKSAFCRGYYSPNDGGGGVFNATNTVAATNTGTRIKSAISGWSMERPAGPIDVRYFGALPDYTGSRIVAGTGTDNRVAIQAALDYAFTQGSGGRDDYLRNTSYTVVLPKGKYYVGAPASGMPSLQIPLGVTLRFPEAEIHLGIPPTNSFGHGILEPNPAWCGILAGPLANIEVGTLQIAAGQNQTYGSTWFGYTLDGIRVQESDVGWIVGGGGERYIYNFARGAGIRILASYDMHIKDLNFGSSGYGVVIGYLGNAFNAYTLYRGGTDAERVSTSMWVDHCVFRNIYRTPILSGAGGDYFTPGSAGAVLGGLETFVADGRSEQGGPITISHTSMEQTAFGAVTARCQTSALLIDDMRLEESQENTTAFGVIYGDSHNFKIIGFTFSSTGTRNITFGHYGSTDTSSNVIPRVVFHCDGVNTSPLLQNIYLPISAISNTKLLTLGPLSRLPTIINYQAGTFSNMQGTDSSVQNIIFDNDGGRIWSVSTIGLAPLETVNGTNTVFSFVNGQTAQIPKRVQIDGLMRPGTNASGSVNWSWGTTNITLTAAPTNDVRAFF